MSNVTAMETVIPFVHTQKSNAQPVVRAWWTAINHLHRPTTTCVTTSTLTVVLLLLVMSSAKIPIAVEYYYHSPIPRFSSSLSRLFSLLHFPSFAAIEE